MMGLVPYYSASTQNDNHESKRGLFSDLKFPVHLNTNAVNKNCRALGKCPAGPHYLERVVGKDGTPSLLRSLRFQLGDVCASSRVIYTSGIRVKTLSKKIKSFPQPQNSCLEVRNVDFTCRTGQTSLKV